jgi:hypothetical protein
VNKTLLDAVLRRIEAAVGGDLNESLGGGGAGAGGGGAGGGGGEEGFGGNGGGDKASRASLAVSLLALLATWLHGCPLAVATLLRDRRNLFLVEITANPLTSDECGHLSALASSVHGLAILVSYVNPVVVLLAGLTLFAVLFAVLLCC